MANIYDSIQSIESNIDKLDAPTIIVGRNGSGKTSLASIIRSQWDGHYMGRLSKSELNDFVVTFDKEYDIKLDYLTESDNKKGKSFADMDYLLSDGAMGIAAMRASSGQAQNMQLFELAKKIDVKMSTIVVLGEPEQSLDLEAQLDLSKLLNTLALHIDIIVVTHSPVIIKNTNMFVLFDMDQKKYVKTEDYLKKYNL